MFKEAFGNYALGRTQTFEWLSRFKNGRMSLEDDERSGRPSSGMTPENVEKVRQAIQEDRRWIVEDVCNVVGLTYGTRQRILVGEPNMRRIAAKFDPIPLTEDQKRQRVEQGAERTR